MIGASAAEQRVFRLCRELIGILSEQWQAIDSDALGRTKAALLLMATATGLVECRLRCRAWTDVAAVQAEAVVVGLWLDLDGRSVLPDEFRKAIPAWAGKRVSVQVEPKSQARLTREGLEAQAHLESPMDLAWMVMGYMVNHPRAARVKLRLLGSPPGRARALDEVQRAVDGMAVSPAAGSSDEDVRKAQQRVRKAISNLRRQLVESELDTHVLIVKGGTQQEPDYTLVSRFGG